MENKLDYLFKLKDDVNDILLEILDKGIKFENDGVNYRSLDCVSTEYYVDISRGTGVRAYIEEVSPDVMEFRVYMATELQKLGYLNIEIITEW